MPARLRLVHGHRVSGRRGFEAHGEEHDLPGGVLGGDPERVERRVDDADVAAGGLDGQEVAVGAGDAQHVAERTEDHVGPGGQRNRAIDLLERRDTHRAAGAVQQRDVGWQQFVDTVFENGVRLPAADLHDRPGPGDQPADGAEQLPGRGGIPVLVDEPHAAGSPPSSRSGASRLSSSKISAASASSIRLSANPAWTMT